MKNNGSKTILIFFLLIPLLIGGVILRFETSISIPLAIIIQNIAGLIFYVFVIIGCILCIFDMIKEKNKSKGMKTILIMPLTIIVVAIFSIYGIKNIYLASKDIIEGPKKIEISDPSVLTDYGGKIKDYYLVGYINGNEKKIRIRTDKRKKYVEEKINGCKTISIYYHENLNTLYQVDEVDK